jgi:outer membrane protein assembly factor BamB
VDGILYVSPGYRHGSEGYRIARGDGDAWVVQQIWRTSHADNLHGGPIIRDGFVFAAGYDRRGAFCLDLKAGAFKWRHKPIGRSSYTFADGLLHRLGEDGTMAFERFNPKMYEPVCSFRIPTARTSKCLTHPVVCGKRLYIRHQQNLYCYDTADPKAR